MESEAWEFTLFAGDRLELYLEKERLRYEDEGRIDQFEAHETLVRGDWANGRIVAGQNYHECDGTVAFLIESYYCFATR